MEQEEEWERDLLLDPAWEKQQRKVCCFPRAPVSTGNENVLIRAGFLQFCWCPVATGVVIVTPMRAMSKASLSSDQPFRVTRTTQ